MAGTLACEEIKIILKTENRDIASLVTCEIFVELEHFGICLDTVSPVIKRVEKSRVCGFKCNFTNRITGETYEKPSTLRLAKFLALERATYA